MNELVRGLPQRAVVLDLGCGSGSLDWAGSQFTVVRVDLEFFKAFNFVQADAANLPFTADCFDVVISNHSLEHVENLAISLAEIGRVLKSTGCLYIAVPDATTITDRLYRWLARGGGHVNQFSSPEQLTLMVEQATGLKHKLTRTLCTSLSFLNRNNRRTRAPRRLLLIGGGTEISLLLFNYFFRLLDRTFGSRMSVYGWAFYFGNIEATIDRNAWTNVCIRCGAGHPSDWLIHECKVVRYWLISVYWCPNCGTMNLFTKDNHFLHFRNTDPRRFSLLANGSQLKS